MAFYEPIEEDGNEANSIDSTNSINPINPTNPMDATCPDRLRNRLLQPLTLLVALAFLNAVLNMDAGIPGRPWESFLQLSPELLVLAIGMSLRVRRDTRFRPAFYAPIAAAVIFLALFRLADNLALGLPVGLLAALVSRLTGLRVVD